MQHVADKMATFANWAWREGAAVYVIPGTVAAAGQAKSADVLQMQTVVVDLDTGDIAAKLDHLRAPSRPAHPGGRKRRVHVRGASTRLMSGGS